MIRGSIFLGDICHMIFVSVAALATILYLCNIGPLESGHTQKNIYAVKFLPMAGNFTTMGLVEVPPQGGLWKFHHKGASSTEIHCVYMRLQASHVLALDTAQNNLAREM